MVVRRAYKYFGYKCNRIYGNIKSNILKSDPPGNIVFLVTIPRCGSTLLLDTLRTHPQIFYSNRSTVYNGFNLDGYRYPLDLLQKKGSRYNFENKFGQWAQIPVFTPPTVLANKNNEDKNLYYIEKIHPEFFNYDSTGFVSKVKNHQELGNIVKIIYIVREPQSVVSSWFSYKERNHDWNRNKENSKVVEYYLKNYKSISEMSSQFPGPIIDFSSLVNDLEPTLQSLYQYLWQRQITVLDINIIKTSINLTDRNKRQSKNTKFLGKNVGKTKGSFPEYENFLDLNKEELAECVSIYNDLAWD